jgi:membrane protease YdiL (CAAX protease family)
MESRIRQLAPCLLAVILLVLPLVVLDLVVPIAGPGLALLSGACAYIGLVFVLVFIWWRETHGTKSEGKRSK